MSAHKIQWWAYAWNHDGEVHKIRRSHTMRGEWGYDVVCSCGWETRTGGAIRSYIEREVRIHKIIEADS